MLLKPDLLLADEPTSALDVTVQKQVVEELLLMKKEFHTAMLLITHNIGVVRKMADRILVLQNGKVMDYGDTQKIRWKIRKVSILVSLWICDPAEKTGGSEIMTEILLKAEKLKKVLQQEKIFAAVDEVPLN